MKTTNIYNQANSYPCRICGEVYSEESGAEKGFVCENCIDQLEKNSCEHIITSEDTHDWCKNCRHFKEYCTKKKLDIGEAIELILERYI